MQFSVIFEAQLANPTRAREQQVIRDCLEQAIFAEEMGFDRVWAVEHHSLYLSLIHIWVCSFPGPTNPGVACWW